MKKSLIRWRRNLLIAAVIFLLLFLSAGCTTTFEEWSGNMANQSSSTHVAAYTGQENSSELTSQQPTIGVVRHPVISGRAPANQAGRSPNLSSPGSMATPQPQSGRTRTSLSSNARTSSPPSGPSSFSGSSPRRP